MFPHLANKLQALSLSLCVVARSVSSARHNINNDDDDTQRNSLTPPQLETPHERKSHKQDEDASSLYGPPCSREGLGVGVATAIDMNINMGGVILAPPTGLLMHNAGLNLEESIFGHVGGVKATALIGV